MGNSRTGFNGKVAFVTGGASGIGRATALAYARDGADVAVVDMDSDGGVQTAKMIETMGRKAIFIKCDVGSDAEVKKAITATVDRFGRLDCAFNNAGIEGAQALTADATEENFDRVIRANLKGVWLCMKYQIPHMLRQGGGSIVNCSSVAGLEGFQGIPAYVASKHGVVGLTRAAALEYAQKNIRVNAVCPGVIQTPMIDRFTHGDAQIQKSLAAGEPVGRVGRPEEVAEAAVWLSSDAASFVTGHPMAVDGGWVAQ
ncbi:MAG TPA: SDR family oxidoreductase [Bdellovibrionota bacterium]|jgi:NAD(P)-dependent dehydrogenase (short-subunit alcohol dehydrogenase family)|nr:SDR family oxidoreductase [Bdellovibrionota bacterium]